MRKIAISLLMLCGVASAMYQYDDYPTGDYEYKHDRIAVSPLKLLGGINSDDIRKGPQPQFDGLPGIDMLTLRYEHVNGPQGTYAFGPIVSIYPVAIGDDNAFQAFAGGGFFRYYSGIASETYFQVAAEFFKSSGAKFGVGNPGGTDPLTGKNNYDGNAKVDIMGPQITPVVGYSFLFDKKWFVNLQLGYTVGYYSVKYTGGHLGDGKAVDNNKEYAKAVTNQDAYKSEGKGYYEDGWRFGSFLHSGIELGAAF